MLFARGKCSKKNKKNLLHHPTVNSHPPVLRAPFEPLPGGKGILCEGNYCEYSTAK